MSQIDTYIHTYIPTYTHTAHTHTHTHTHTLTLSRVQCTRGHRISPDDAMYAARGHAFSDFTTPRIRITRADVRERRRRGSNSSSSSSVGGKSIHHAAVVAHIGAFSPSFPLTPVAISRLSRAAALFFALFS